MNNYDCYCCCSNRSIWITQQICKLIEIKHSQGLLKCPPLLSLVTWVTPQACPVWVPLTLTPWGYAHSIKKIWTVCGHQQGCNCFLFTIYPPIKMTFPVCYKFKLHPWAMITNTWNFWTSRRLTFCLIKEVPSEPNN